jgi:NADPH:quinone reductase-like Zn-dependent oxidoreductase
MKAAQINEYGGESAMQTVEHVPKPEPGDGEVQVEVYAAAANPFDWKVRDGLIAPDKLEFPATLGGDCAGTVSALGANVQGFEVGQPVFGQAGAASGHGSFAEFTVVKATSLASKPENVDYVTAAALPLAAVSAYQALVDHANLQPGQKILIHGGAGGLGAMAVQIAKSLGAYVAATCSQEDMDYVKEIGADEAIDYKSQDFSEILKDYDAVFDTVGGDANEKSYKILRPGGVLVSMTSEENERSSKEKDIHYVHQFTRATPERLLAVKELVEAGKVKVNIDKVFSLDEASQALEYLKTGHHRGKVVISIKG